MKEEVLAAMAKAKWNESVTVDIESEEGGSSRIILVPKLDRENGGIKWEQVSDAAAKTIHLQTKKWLFPMLNDKRRNNLYDEAIEKAVSDVSMFSDRPNHGGYFIRSLDIGTGTGLLAMLTENHLAHVLNIWKYSTKQYEIKSLEMAGPMADLASSTIEIQRKKRLKKIPNVNYNLEVIECHSCKFPSIKDNCNTKKTQGGAHFCTSELLESGLLGEGWLPAMRDAWERHLHPDATVLPQRARVVAQLVQGAANFCGPHQTLEVGRDELRLFTTAPQSSDVGMLSDGSYDPSTGLKHGIQVEIHADRYLNDDNDSEEPVLKTLSNPIVALSIDVTSPESLPKADAMTPHRAQFVATDSGDADGILFWWELDLFKNLTYSTEPGSEFQDHWHQCLYVLPSSSKIDDDIQVKEDQEYTLLATHTDSRVHFSVTKETSEESQPKDSKKPKPTIPEQGPPVAGPFRCWQLNDVSRSAKLRDGIRHALEHLSATSSCVNVLDISDFSLCAMIASLEGAQRVTSLESSSSGLPLATAKVAQIGNNLPKENNVFQIVQCHAESLTREIVMEGDNDNNDKDGVVDLVVGEPYYEMLEGCPIETALNYFYTIRMLKRKHIVKPTALCVPARAEIMACGIECADLASAYNCDLSSAVISKGSKAQVCGFDHTPIADCWNYDKHGISLPLWEYNNVVPVTEIVNVGTLDYETITITEGHWIQKDGNSLLMAPFTKENRICHAIAFWVDYGIRTESMFEKLSTGFGASHLAKPPIAERQTVRILAKGTPAILGQSLAIPRHGLKL